MSVLKKSLILIATALSVAACSNEPDPEALTIARESAVTQYIAESDEKATANKKVASAFFAEGVTNEDRYALLHDDYIQHNPIYAKFAKESGISDKEAFKQMRQPGGGAAQRGAGAAGGGAAQDGPRPPRGNPLFMVLAEGDLVFIMRQQFRQDPAKEPGNFYELFAWDTFRIKDGKLYEHWDGNVLPPPANN